MRSASVASAPSRSTPGPWRTRSPRSGPRARSSPRPAGRAGAEAAGQPGLPSVAWGRLRGGRPTQVVEPAAREHEAGKRHPLLHHEPAQEVTRAGERRGRLALAAVAATLEDERHDHRDQRDERDADRPGDGRPDQRERTELEERHGDDVQQEIAPVSMLRRVVAPLPGKQTRPHSARASQSRTANSSTAITPEL